jgi:hypothetical protein
MKLSAEQFADLAASFPGYSAEEHARCERRRASRLELRSQVVARVLNANGMQGAPTTLTVVNFSPRGFGLLVREPLSPGTQFVTELPRKSGGAVALLCTVVHARPVSEGLHQVGVEFTCVLHAPAAPAQIHQLAEDVNRIRHSVLD